MENFDQDIISWAGVILIFLAFFLLSTERLRSDSKLYHIMNIAGASFLGWGAILINSVPFIILEAIWVVAAFYGLIRSRKGLV